MGRIKGKDTKPELLVRSLIHRMGYRFRLHRSDLPGKPDITLPRYKKVVFVHGCFWHGHQDCSRSKRPVTNEDFWNEKLSKNVERDNRNTAELRRLGWDPLVVWTCEIKDVESLQNKIRDFLAK